VDTINSADKSTRQPGWLRNLVLGTSVALLWLVLAYGIESTVVPRGSDRPLCVLVGEGGLMPALGIALFAVIGAIAAAWLVRCREGSHGLLIVALALAIWAYPGGTMDDWLKYKNTTIGPPSGSAYVPLLGEYLYWALVTAFAFYAAGGKPLAAFMKKDAQRNGLTALLITVAVATLLILILSGPRQSRTYHGQVYFSVAVAFILAVMTANRVCGVREPAWYLPAPIIVGVLGVLFAVFKPSLGTTYAYVNVIPANGLARPLPVEMIVVGVAAILLTLRAADRISSD
jgi:hypothetical protein